MALTGDAKEELSHLEITRPSARKAEAAATLRFAGGLHLVAGRVVVEAELDSAAVARRLHATIASIAAPYEGPCSVCGSSTGISITFAMIFRHSGLLAPPPHSLVRGIWTPFFFAASKQSRSANATPSSIASVISPRVVSGRIPMNAPRAVTSLCGLLSPMR